MKGVLDCLPFPFEEQLTLRLLVEVEVAGPGGFDRLLRPAEVFPEDLMNIFDKCARWRKHPKAPI